MQIDNDGSQRSHPWLIHGLALLLILGAALLHVLYLGWLTPLDLAPDEAHYWDWSRHLDWSYYSKGPLVAYLIHASCWLTGSWSEALTGNQMLAVRLPAVTCGGLLLVSLYVLTIQIFRSPKLALAVVIFGLTMPILALGSTLMTIDSPYCCCWGWALVAGWHAVTRRSLLGWVAAGLLVGVGILAKYTMVLWLPSMGLFLLVAREYRHELLRPGFWIAVCLAGLCCLPILIWNLQNGWVTFRHVGGQAGLTEENGIQWLGPFQFVGVQAAILLGFWFVTWIVAIVHYRPWRATIAPTRYLWCMSAPMFALFLCFSLRTRCEPNWPVTAYLSGLVLAAYWLAEMSTRETSAWAMSLRAGTVTACALGLGTIVIMHRAELVHPLLASVAGAPTAKQPAPLRNVDPTCRLRGWRYLASQIDLIRKQLRDQGEDDPIIVTASWTLPGEIGFYCQGRPQAYCMGILQGDRHSQYDLWHPNPVEEWEGYVQRTFIFVGEMTLPVKTAFDAIEPAQTIVYSVDGRPVASWSVSVCRSYRGVPHILELRKFATF
jgi:Dolichyl-phosphate-mannose-protein mannosyltransferase